MVQRYTENSQQLDRPVSGAIQSQDFSAGSQAIAQGVEQFAGSMKQAGEHLDQVAAARDEAVVRKFDAEDAPTIAKMRATALSSQGLDAEAATTQTLQQMQELRRTREKDLKTPRQRAMYGEIFDRRYAATVGDFTTHATTQTLKANVAAAGARADSYIDVAVQEYDKPEAFNQAVATGVAEIAHSLPGQAPEVVAQAKRKYVSGIHTGVVEQLLAQPEGAGVMDAEKWISDHHADILPEDETKLRRMVNPLMDEQRVDADFGRVMSGATEAPTDKPDPAADPSKPAPPAPASGTHRAEVFSKDPATAVLRGAGHVTNTAAQHRARGSQNALDIAAPAGTPIHPPMSGKVLKNWWSPEGGWSVLIEHPNGKVTGYAHMRAKSALDVGSQVDADTVIGGVGNTGAKSHGNHVHFTVRNAPGGPKVDPATVQWDSVNVPNTVSPHNVNWSETGVQPFHADDGSGISRALDTTYQLAKRENWSPKHYEQVVASVRQHFGVNEQLYNKAQRDQVDAASAAIAQADLDGKPLTQVSQIPNFGSLDKGSQAQVLSRLAANRKAALGETEGGVKANGSTFADLAVGAIEQPEQFANVNIDLIPDITPGERTRLKVQQANVRKDLGKGGTGHTTQGSTILTAINRYAGNVGSSALGFKTTGMKDQDKQLRGQLLTAVQAEVQRREAGGVKLTDDQIDAIVKQQTIPIIRRRSGLLGSHDTSIPYYQAHNTPRASGERDIVRVPTVDKQRIVAAWQRAHGGAMPSEPMIATIYLQRQGQ